MGIDVLRGAVIVLMALDHVRDFWTPTDFDVTNLRETSVGWFLTRWVTHFCAPVFIFLAGIGASLWRDKPGRTKLNLAGFLASRGAWLILVEFAFVSIWWTLNQPGTQLVAQVIWVIGASMLVLAVLQFLPRWAVGAIGLALVIGHNALDGRYPGEWTTLYGTLGQNTAMVVHGGGFFAIGKGVAVFINYPLVPWAGVMALGYVAAPVLRWSGRRRAWACVITGLLMVGAFLVLRGMNLYGDPQPWRERARYGMTFCSWLNCEKYPPSLLYLLMTLGPTILLYPLIERVRGFPARFLATFGRVPFFFYIIHLPFIIVTSMAVGHLRFGPEAWEWGWTNRPPPEFNLGLWMCYAAWAGTVALLYPACWAFVRLKRRGWWWMGYF